MWNASTREGRRVILNLEAVGRTLKLLIISCGLICNLFPLSVPPGYREHWAGDQEGDQDSGKVSQVLRVQNVKKHSGSAFICMPPPPPIGWSGKLCALATSLSLVLPLIRTWELKRPSVDSSLPLPFALLEWFIETIHFKPSSLWYLSNICVNTV